MKLLPRLFSRSEAPKEELVAGLHYPQRRVRVDARADVIYVLIEERYPGQDWHTVRRSDPIDADDETEAVAEIAGVWKEELIPWNGFERAWAEYQFELKDVQRSLKGCMVPLEGEGYVSLTVTLDREEPDLGDQFELPPEPGPEPPRPSHEYAAEGEYEAQVETMTRWKERRVAFTKASAARRAELHRRRGDGTLVLQIVQSLYLGAGQPREDKVLASARFPDRPDSVAPLREQLSEYLDIWSRRQREWQEQAKLKFEQAEQRSLQAATTAAAVNDSLARPMID